MIRYFVGVISPIDGQPFKLYINDKDENRALRIAQCFVGDQAKDCMYSEDDGEEEENGI